MDYLAAFGQWTSKITSTLNQYTAWLADQIFDGEQWHFQKALLAKEGKVQAILPASELPDNIPSRTYPPGTMLSPAFIDLQIYGAMGKLLSVHPATYALDSLQQYTLKGGTTWTLPTVSTNTYEVFHQCIDAVRAFWQQGGNGILGLHIEGPWLHALRKGAHREEWIHKPSADQVKSLLEYGKGVIKMITLAPEVVGDDIIDLVRSYGVIVSAGHSNATYEEATHSFSKGISAVTHLFNAMSPLQHRAPGLAGAALDHASVMVSFIPDGYHVDFAALRIAHRAAGERLFVITDAVTDCNEGPYPHQLAGDKYESNGVLSGSALQMNQAVRNLVKKMNLSPAEAIRLCSVNPARLFGRPDITGKLLPGHRADLVLMNEDFEVLETYRSPV